MSYAKSCNVDAVKTFDLRVRTKDNFSPGLYSTLAAGPAEVYGSPLAWEYILLLSDVAQIKNIHSTLISTSFSTLSTNIQYVSSYLDLNTKLVSTALLNQFNTFEISNVYLQGTLIYDVYNFYDRVNRSMVYPSSLSTNTYNYSTISTYIKNLEPTLATFSTISSLFYYGNSTIKTINSFDNPEISTISSQLIIYRNLLPVYLLNEVRNINSTVSTSVYNYLTYQSTIFSFTLSTFINFSSFLLNSYSTQYQIYSTINQNYIDEQKYILQTQFSSFSTIVGNQFSSVQDLYDNVILSTLSTANWTLLSNTSTILQPINDRIINTYSTLISTISTDQGSQQVNNSIITNILGYNNFINLLSSSIGQLYYYSTITRPQVYYTLNIIFNNTPISTFYYTSTLGQDDLSTNQSYVYNLLEQQVSVNTPALSTLFSSNIYNSYYNIIKEYRNNGIPLIDTLCNIIFTSAFISSFGYPANISTAFSQYSTVVNSSILQSYKIVLQSERQSIQNVKTTFVTFSTTTYAISNLTATAFTSLSNEMRLSTLTTFNSLLNNTFRSFRSNSELTSVILNQTEASNYTVMSNLFNTIKDHTLQDSFYLDLSTIKSINFSTTKSILTSTSFGLLDTDSTVIINYSTISSLSTFYFSNISSSQSTIFGISFTNLNSTNKDAIAFNESTVSTQLSYVDPVASSIANYLFSDFYSSLSTTIEDRNQILSSFVLEVSNTFQYQIENLSTKINTYVNGQADNLENLINTCNTRISQFFSTIFSNSISLNKPNQIVLSSFRTLSSINIHGPLQTLEAGATLTSKSIYPLEITNYNGHGSYNILFVNSSVNEVLVNSIKISGFLSTIFSNTLSTINLDINQYQNFLVDIRTMSNASPTVELNINLSTLSRHTQEGIINISISPPSANEIAAGRFLNILNLGPTVRLNITKSYGYLKYKYLTINNKTFLSQNKAFTKVISSVLPAGNVTTLTQLLSADFVGIVNDSLDNLFITNNSTNSVFKYNIYTGELKEFVNGINIPFNIAIDYNNILYTVSFADNLVYKILPDGTKIALALTDGNSPFTIQSPIGIAVDSTAKYLYVSSLSSCIIYQIDLANYLTVPFVGSEPGYLDGFNTSAKFGIIFGMTIDNGGILYVSDFTNNSIRRIVISTQIVTTIFGPLPTSGSAGEAGNTIYYDNTNIPTSDPANEEQAGNDARFSKPTGLVADNLGNLFVCDAGNFAIRRLNINTSQVITISGKKFGGFTDGAILSAGYTQLHGLTINNGKTNFFACDFSRIRQVGYNINAITGNSAQTITANTIAEAAARYAVTLYGPMPLVNQQNTQFTGIAVGVNFGAINKTYTLTAARSNGIIITYTTSAPHDLVSGQFVSIVNFSPSSYNINGIIYVTSQTQFTIKSTLSADNASGNGIAYTFFSLVYLLTYNDMASNACVIYQFDVENEILQTFVSIPSHNGNGMCIDRNTNNLYVSVTRKNILINKDTSFVYKITPNGTIIPIAHFWQQNIQSITINTEGTIIYVCVNNVIYQIDLAIALTVVFNSTWGDQTWTCPDGVSTIGVTMLGGSAGCYDDTIFNGSPGGFVSGTLPITPNQMYTIVVGQGGYNSGGWWTSQGQGGYGGGGTGDGTQYGASGGGGRSAIKEANIDLVTVGGAAGSFYTQGGVGGDPNGGGVDGYIGASGSSGGGGGGNPAGSTGQGGKSYTDNLLPSSVISIPGGANNGYHLGGGQTSDGLIIITAGVSVLAGSGNAAIVDGAGTAVSINAITGMTYDSGIIYFTDTNTIRKLNVASKNVVTIAGNNTAGSANGIGQAAQFNLPSDIRSDLNGSLYVLDSGNNAIRKIDIRTRIVTTLMGNVGINLYPPSSNPDGFLNKALLFQPTKMDFDHPSPQLLEFKDLYILDDYGLILRGLYASYTNASYPMSTIVSIDSGLISQYVKIMSSVTQSLKGYVTNTSVQYINTLNSYATTANAPISVQKPVYIQSASNAVIDVSGQYISSQIASSIASSAYLNLVNLSTLASPLYLSSSYLANIYLSSSSNYLYNGKLQSTIAANAYQQAKTDANVAANASVAANNTQANKISQIFSFTGSDQFFTVPPNVTTITVELIGAGGGGTLGGYVLGNLTVTPGTQYLIIVGLGANSSAIYYPSLGGPGLGGGGGGNGGGRSAIQLYNGTDLATAGGGGGTSGYSGTGYTIGGNGGGLVGQSAPNGGGGGGTQFAGGSPAGFGAANGYYENGGSGANGGGGGGGGYYGGGGGGSFNQGGGGGSSYVENLTGTVINLQGAGLGVGNNGQVTVYYNPPVIQSFPATLGNCVFWFDAADTATTIGGNLISSWANKGSTGGYANTFSGYGTPLSGQSNINGLNSIYFPPYSFMGFTSALGATDVTFFIVTAVNNLTGDPSFGILFGSQDSVFSFQEIINYNNNGTYQLLPTAYTSANFSKPPLYPQFQTLAIATPASLPNPFGNYKVVSITQLSGSSGLAVNKTYLDGNFITGSYGNQTAVYTPNTQFYEINDPNTGLSQNLGEIIVFNRILSETEIAQVNTYLMNKWGAQPYLTSTLAGSMPGPAMDGTGAGATFGNPAGIALLNDGNLLVTDYLTNTIRIITYPAGVVTTIAGQMIPGAQDGTGTQARFTLANSAIVMSDGNVIVADSGNHALRLIQYTNSTTPAVVTTYAGRLAGPGNTLGGDYTNSSIFTYPNGIVRFVRASQEFIAVCDTGNNQIRILTYTNASGVSDTDYVLYSIQAPISIAYLQDGNFAVICDNDSHIYFLAVIYGAFTGFSQSYTSFPVSVSINGFQTSGTTGFKDGLVTDALFNLPRNITTLPSGNLVVNDTGNYRIRHITYPDGIVTTIGGNGTSGLVNGMGSANNSFSASFGATSVNGDIVITDTFNAVIRVITGFPMYIYDAANISVYGNKISCLQSGNQIYSVKATPQFAASCVINTIPSGLVFFGISSSPNTNNFPDSFLGYGIYISGTSISISVDNQPVTIASYALGNTLQIIADQNNFYFYVVDNATQGDIGSGYSLLGQITYVQNNYKLDIWFQNASDFIDNVIFTPLTYSDGGGGGGGGGGGTQGLPILNDPTISGINLTMSWSAPTGPTPDTYNVDIYGDGSLITTQSTSLLTAYYTLYAMNNGTTYTFYVTAVYGLVPGTISAQSNPVLYSYPDLGTPTLNDNILNMSWSAPPSNLINPSPSSYTVKIHKDSNQVASHTLGNVFSDTYTIPARDGNGNYTFYVIPIYNTTPGITGGPSSSVTYSP